MSGALKVERSRIPSGGVYVHEPALGDVNAFGEQSVALGGQVSGDLTRAGEHAVGRQPSPVSTFEIRRHHAKVGLACPDER